MNVVRNIVLVLLCAAALDATAVTPRSAPPSVAISHAWIRWLPGALPAAAYATVTNHGDRRVRLVGATSPDYAAVMLHRSMTADGTARMETSRGIDVGAGASVRLAPGGYHLMLMQPRRAIVPGDEVRLRLRFADGATLDATFPVRPANAQGAD
ncbi:MAG TPA: copper chaperone PCu(A)C [Rhodanobacteraceae bacterium]|nr:copper chaperone PCu(A)C [Rhodanobacteraceae bacterium]